MKKSPSGIFITEEDLYGILRGLEASTKMVNRLLSLISAEAIMQIDRAPLSPTQVPVVEESTRDMKNAGRPSLGRCMFVQKRLLKDVASRGGLMDHKARCEKTAFYERNGLVLCSRHKDADTSRMEELFGRQEVPEAGPSTPPLLAEGSYHSTEPPLPISSFSGPSDVVEEAMKDVNRLGRMVEENRLVPCRISSHETSFLPYKGTVYVVSPCHGVCYGKVVDEEILSSYEIRAKVREYLDISGRITYLTEADRGFLIDFELIYSKEFVSRSNTT